MLPRPLLAAPLAAALLGCSANVAPSAEAADAEASPVTAVVTVERTAQGDFARSEVVARFLRVRTGQAGPASDEALAMVGASLDLPAEGGCAKLPMPETRGVAHTVELLDVGAVSLDFESPSAAASSPDRTLSLAPRRLPDVVDLVSGVVYTTRASESAPLATPVPAKGGHFVLHVAGAPELDIAPLRVDATIAGEPTDVHVSGGASLGDGESAPIEIAWTPASSSSDAQSDLVYIDVVSHGVPTARCTFADGAGRAVLASSSLAGDDLLFTVHRLHREPFHARGVDFGELRFDFSRSIPFRRP